MKTKECTLKRFMDKIFKRSDGCWTWLGCNKRDLYGSFTVDKKAWLAHRWIYEYYNGPLGNLLCLHTCNNASCVNPDHLYAGTQINNMQDRIEAGNNPQTNKTHCPLGHKYDLFNIRITKKGRDCRTCQIIRNRDRYTRSRLQLRVGKININ